MAEVIDGILISEVETKNIMTKSSLPVGGYSVNPYVGCTHACKYCYASFMKRFTGHTEEWGTFLDVKHWPEIKNPNKICWTASGHRFCDGWLQSTGGAIREYQKTSGAIDWQ